MVLLTHAYYLQEDSKEQKIMRPYPPLGILYISAYLEQQGIENEVFDTTFSSKSAFKKYMRENKPRFIGIYINLMTKLNVLETINWIKQEPDLQHITVFVGGPDVRYNAENLLTYGADFVVIGEGEETTYELVSKLSMINYEDFKSIDGIAFKNKNQEVIFTQERTKIKNINELPFPNRSKIDLSKYLNVWKDFHGENAISISTMRGCPYTCKWCSRAVYGLSYRRRSPEIVAEEILKIKNEYNPDTLWFVDDVFTISHKWLKDFNLALKKLNVKIPYECITRADRMNAEAIILLKESGCFRVWIGAESGSQKVIDLMDRRVEIGKVREMIQLTRQSGIQVGTFIMLGYPGETEEDIEETIKHLKIANPDYFTITVAYPIKGTELYTETEEIQTSVLDWTSSTDREIDFHRTYSRKYYDYAVTHVTTEVNLYKNRLQKGFQIGQLKLILKSKIAHWGMWWERKKFGIQKV